MAKLLEKIEPIKTLGDRYHNNNLQVLFSGVDSRTKTYKKVNDLLHKYLENSSHIWIFNVVNKGDLQRLNAAMKSKTDKTFQKRIVNLINHLAHDSHYGVMFNRRLIEDLTELI
jgi:hypothetical protein